MEETKQDHIKRSSTRGEQALQILIPKERQSALVLTCITVFKTECYHTWPKCSESEAEFFVMKVMQRGAAVL